MKTDHKPVIEAKHLSASFGQTTIWSDAEFSIYPGEFIAVLGPNGAGKSTLLRMLLGLHPSVRGTLKVLGASPQKGNPGIAYVPQHRAIDPEGAISGYDLVGFGVDGHKWGAFHTKEERAQKDTDVADAIEAVQATEYAGRRLGELSGGERQRLLLAQALVGHPSILLLDEPAANLDLKNQVALAELVARIARERNIAVLLVTHDLNPLLQVVHRVLYIGRHGLAIGTPEEVITANVLSRLYNTNVEVLTDTRGRSFIVGLEDVMAHPHAMHNHSHDSEEEL